MARVTLKQILEYFLTNGGTVKKLQNPELGSGYRIDIENTVILIFDGQVYADSQQAFTKISRCPVIWPLPKTSGQFQGLITRLLMLESESSK